MHHSALSATNRLHRLKKVQGKKKRDTAARQIEADAQAAKDNAPSVTDYEEYDEEAATDLLSGKDSDVIF